MAMSEERLVELFRKLPETDKNLTVDFVELLATRRAQEFLDSLDEVDEPLSAEELRQMQDPDNEPIALDDLAKELGWDIENHPE